jgi:hypothetical protein
VMELFLLSRSAQKKHNQISVFDLTVSCSKDHILLSFNIVTLDVGILITRAHRVYTQRAMLHCECY